MTARSQRQTTPWLNGQGSTQVVLATGAWRISVADEPLVSKFSVFAGYDRVIMPIGRVSLHLEDPQRHTEPGTRPSLSKVVRPLVSFAFPGEWAPVCRSSAPTRALNVMTKRGAAAVAIRMKQPNPPAVSDALRLYFDVETEVALVVPPGAQHEPVHSGRYVLITIT